MTMALNTLEALEYNDYQRPSVTFDQGMSLQEIEKSVILGTLERQRYNRTRTARVLGIGIRTLQRKLKQYREIDGDLILDFPSH